MDLGKIVWQIQCMSSFFAVEVFRQWRPGFSNVTLLDQGNLGPCVGNVTLLAPGVDANISFYPLEIHKAVFG